jgi:predicted nucleotidyltransferase
MRLTPTEQQAIASAARATLPPGTRVSLFGSRVHDTARGGDIDLLVDSPQPVTAPEWVARRQVFVAQLYRTLGERRIDVVMSGTGPAAAAKAVVASARRQAIELVVT